MKYLIIAVLSTYYILLTPVPASASVLLSDNTNSDVVVREENGVKYLTTQITQANTTTPTPTAEPTPSPEENANEDSQPNTEDVVTTDTTLSSGEEIDVPEGFFRNFSILFNRILRVVLAVAALLTLGYLIFGAFKWITSGGDKGKTESARNSIISAVIGLVIVASSYAILLLTLNFLGYESLEDVIDDAQLEQTYVPPTE